MIEEGGRRLWGVNGSDSGSEFDVKRGGRRTYDVFFQATFDIVDLEKGKD